MSRPLDQVASIITTLELYRGYELIPLAGKIPIRSGWRWRDYSDFDWLGWLAEGGNIGFRLQPRDLVIDCDPRNYRPGHDPLQELCKVIGIDLRAAPATITGSGGLHLFFRKPPNLRTVVKLAGYEGLDFLAECERLLHLGAEIPIL